MLYVKSPVASLCLACSSVRNLVSVMMSVLTCSLEVGGLATPFAPLVAMIVLLQIMEKFGTAIKYWVWVKRR